MFLLVKFDNYVQCGNFVSLQRIVHQRVLPALSNEFRNHKMIPFVLPLVLLIAEDCTLQEYCTLIMPVITPALSIQDPVQVRVDLYHMLTLYHLR